jgi:hypothetical protein
MPKGKDKYREIQHFLSDFVGTVTVARLREETRGFVRSWSHRQHFVWRMLRGRSSTAIGGFLDTVAFVVINYET